MTSIARSQPPNPRMQSTGRRCPEVRSGGSSLENEGTQIYVAPPRWPAADLQIVRPLHSDGEHLFMSQQGPSK